MKEFIKLWCHPRVFGWFLGMLAGLVLLGFVSTRLCVYVSGESMIPTIHDKDCLCIDIGKSIEHGSIVTATVKQGQASYDIIKRMIGMPGDHLVIENSVITVNGEVLDEPYLSENNRTFEGSIDMILGEDEYFLLGDNRNNSADSRYFGTFTRSQIRGPYSFKFTKHFPLVLIITALPSLICFFMLTINFNKEIKRVEEEEEKRRMHEQSKFVNNPNDD